MFGPAAWEVGDDEAGVRAEGGRPGAGDDTPLARPAFGLEEPPDRVFATRRAPGRHVITPGRADPGQAFVAGAAEDVEAAQILQHIHDLGRPIMGIAADGDRDARPVRSDLVRSDLADDMAQHLRGLLSRRTLAGAQDGGDRLLRCRLEDQDRLEARPTRRRAEEAELLPAVHKVCRVVDVQHDLARRSLEAVAKGGDHSQAHPGC